MTLGSIEKLIHQTRDELLKRMEEQGASRTSVMGTSVSLLELSASLHGGPHSLVDPFEKHTTTRQRPVCHASHSAFGSHGETTNACLNVARMRNEKEVKQTKYQQQMEVWTKQLDNLLKEKLDTTLHQNSKPVHPDLKPDGTEKKTKTYHSSSNQITDTVNFCATCELFFHKECSIAWHALCLDTEPTIPTCVRSCKLRVHKTIKKLPKLAEKYLLDEMELTTKKKKGAAAKKDDDAKLPPAAAKSPLKATV